MTTPPFNAEGRRQVHNCANPAASRNMGTISFTRNSTEVHYYVHTSTFVPFLSPTATIIITSECSLTYYHLTDFNCNCLFTVFVTPVGNHGYMHDVITGNRGRKIDHNNFTHLRMRRTSFRMFHIPPHQTECVLDGVSPSPDTVFPLYGMAMLRIHDVKWLQLAQERFHHLLTLWATISYSRTLYHAVIWAKLYKTSHLRTFVCIRSEKYSERLNIWQSVNTRTTSHRGGRGSILGQIIVGSVEDKMAWGGGAVLRVIAYPLRKNWHEHCRQAAVARSV
jgi:hypothetical protein